MTSSLSGKIKSICVYCGSSPGLSPHYQLAAQKLGKEMAKHNIRLVYGGGKTGLMGEIARSVFASGGHVTGIIPSFLKTREQFFSEAQEIIETPDMHTRKRIMFEKADAFVALPGGIGTLEELVEQMTWAQLGRHKKPILILDTENFWKPLLDLINHMRFSGFIDPSYEIRALVAKNVEDVLPLLDGALLQEKMMNKDFFPSQQF